MLNTDVQRWACCKNTCKDNGVDTAIYNDHKHDKPSEQDINRQKLSNNLKRKAVEEISVLPSKFICRELKNSDIHTLTLNDTSLIKRNIRNARLSVHPNIPKNIAETHAAINEITLVTNTNESFLLVNDNNCGIVWFSTKSNLEVLCGINTIFVDGTFRSCPNFFYQLFTIHDLVEESYIPLVFFLLPNKETETYVCLFEHTINSCAQYQLIFSPDEVFIDFEIAIHTAAKLVWPKIVIRGCRFHLGQNWWKKIQALGLVNTYKTLNSEKSNFLKYFFGLPFLRPEEVTDATFPPNIWSAFAATTVRTTNSCESYHSRLNRRFYSPHPNIFNFIDELLEVQSETQIKLRSKNQKKKTTLDKEQNLRKQMTKYTSNVITRFEFIKSISMKFL
ncbi:hypothetical protein AGLY_002801, partial [Aphis glycines]